MVEDGRTSWSLIFLVAGDGHSRTTDHRQCEGALHKLHGTDYRFRLILTSSIPTTSVQACSMFLVMLVATSSPSVLQPISGNGPTNATLHLDDLLGSNPFFLHAIRVFRTEILV